ncbi:peptidoglycan hydrolase-like protein with peptidoglycan-binding domain [Mesorhizobium sp. J18]|uniref:peptidoglycan-binding domain-containing protein n=1 Tax=Mesorhizobium sp. J18 TaxID=935263 RepID=UPI001199A014|nr:peptidoglycan-binding protein [Mesorhizobium sp. J18]TWG99295.1 peptidoglycan hydrolase-like protein with peptidoglycan-binding domain [Mesorhizobium sp. J18]
MKRSAKRRKQRSGFASLMLAGLSAAGSAISRNPAVAGGSTAFLVSLFFVSANAMWYQPHFHESAFFATRQNMPAATEPAPVPEPESIPEPTRRPAEPQAAAEPVPAPDRSETTGAVPPPENAAKPGGDETVRKVQEVLGGLNLYRGPVDGLTGPQTRSAIESYQRIVGIEVTGGIDDTLLQHLGMKEKPQESAPPPPTPRPAEVAEQERPVQVASTEPVNDPLIERIQAGLKAFGNDGIEVDGIVGEDTRAAIREFQSLFGLEVTGEPDAALLAKMREIGLTN